MQCVRRALTQPLLVLSSLLVVGCGGGAQREAVAPAVKHDAPLSTAPAPIAKGSLRRSAVQATVARGLGAFLARVELTDQPALKAGKFHGFRIAKLGGDGAFWAGVDVRPGDVITHVNGKSIERPEQALEVFRSLAEASELRVDYERDGAPRTLRMPIVDDTVGRADSR